MLLEQYRNCEVVLIGYNTTMCVLSTIIDGYHRGFKMAFLKDATAAKALSRFDETTTHEYMVDTMSTFARAMTLEEFRKKA